jgi:hypothetical protein
MRRDTLVLDRAGLSLDRPGLKDRLLVRWQARRLNAQLAAGLPAEGDRHRAMRADLLVTPATRAELASCWQNVLDRADRARNPYGPRIPVVRPRVQAARPDIRALIDALRATAPVPARGVALADVLLSDSAGPLYSGRSPLDLRSTIQTAIRCLDPSTTIESELRRY